MSGTVSIYGDARKQLPAGAASIEWIGHQCIVRDAAGNELMRRVQVYDPRPPIRHKRTNEADQRAERYRRECGR